MWLSVTLRRVYMRLVSGPDRSVPHFAGQHCSDVEVRERCPSIETSVGATAPKSSRQIVAQIHPVVENLI